MFAEIIIHAFREMLLEKHPKYVYFFFFPEIALSTTVFLFMLFDQDKQPNSGIASFVFLVYAVYCYFRIKKYTKHEHKQILLNLLKIASITVPILALLGWMLFSAVQESVGVPSGYIDLNKFL